MTVNHDVVGSSPTGGVKDRKRVQDGLFFFVFFSEGPKVGHRAVLDCS